MLSRKSGYLDGLRKILQEKRIKIYGCVSIKFIESIVSVLPGLRGMQATSKTSVATRSPFMPQKTGLIGKSIPFLKWKTPDYYQAIRRRNYKIASRIRINFISKSSRESKASILAPSDLAFDEIGCVSMKSPSAPTAMAALAMVSIS